MKGKTLPNSKLLDPNTGKNYRSFFETVFQTSEEKTSNPDLEKPNFLSNKEMAKHKATADEDWTKFN